MHFWLFSVSKDLPTNIFENEDIIYLHEQLSQLWHEIFPGNHIYKSIESTSRWDRVKDINNFITNSDISHLWALIGWFGSNEILDFIDFSSLLSNDKLICGFSDITVLLNGCYQKTGRMTLHAPNFKTLSKKYPNQSESIRDFLAKINLYGKDFSFSFWNPDSYFDPSTKENINDGWMKFVHKWEAEGIVVWWNLSSVNLVIWTKYEIDLNNKILFLEECDEFSLWIIRRNFFQITSQKSIKWLKWVVFWRINKNCYRDYDLSLANALHDAFKELNIPVVMNAPFGHVSTNEAFYIGSKCNINIDAEGIPLVSFTSA